MLSALLALILSVAPSPVPAPQVLPSIVLGAPRARLHVQVARTEAQRERGLMGVTKLAPHTGMVFVFPNDGPIEFWMKDTLIPLDMVFIGGNKRVRSVFANVPVVPLDTPDNAIPRRDGFAKYVLELPAGEAAADGLVGGVLIRNLP